MFKRIILTILGSLLVLPTYAALNLELTQGINAAIPIAIIPFANEKANVPGNETITQVVKNDLQNSGQFRVKSPGLLDHQPTTLDQINVAHWRKRGVDDVLMGSVESTGFGRYRVSFQLVNIFNKAAQPGESAKASSASSSSVLATYSFDVAKNGLRALSHHISDLVYQKLTGVRGIFTTKIAYILVKKRRHKLAKYLLEISDVDGFKPQTLLISTQPIMSPAWSPNGKNLAYVSFESHHASIYLQNLSTGKRQVITDYPGINGAPAFSPNGKKLALVLTRTGNPKIYTYNLRSNKLTQLTHGYSIDTEPAWSPDGKSLLFTSNRGGTPQVYRYKLETKRVMRITFEGNYNARASFLPNDQGIVMMHRETGLFGIARENLNTGSIQVLAQTGSDESPSVAPNGKMVIYATKYGGRGVLAMVSIDGRIKLRLPAREGLVREPSWSPFLSA